MGIGITALIIEILRAVPRGSDREHRLQEKLVSFYEEARQSDVPLRIIVQDAIHTAHRAALAPDVDIRGSTMMRSEYDIEMRMIVGSAMRLAAETVCSDVFARARTSRRDDELRSSIEFHLRQRRKRARRHRIAERDHSQEESW